MNKDEAVRILKAMAKLGELRCSDNEHEHSKADKILLEYLRDNGAAEVADAWEECDEVIGFWYA